MQGSIQVKESNCSKCGAALRSGMLRCRECGTSLKSASASQKNPPKPLPATPLFEFCVADLLATAEDSDEGETTAPAATTASGCPNCGIELQPNVLRCRDCGHSLIATKSKPSPQPARQPARAPQRTPSQRTSPATRSAIDRPSAAGQRDPVKSASPPATRAAAVPVEQQPTQPARQLKPALDKPAARSAKLQRVSARSGRDDKSAAAASTRGSGKSAPAGAATRSAETATATDSPKAAATAETKKPKLSWFQLRALKKTLATSGLDKPRLAESRRVALQGLVEFQDPRILPLAVHALQDEWIVVREAAAELLGRLKATDAVDPLIHVVSQDDSFDVRRAAGLALSAIGDPRGAFPLIMAGLENPQQRLWVTEAVARIGRPAVPPLVKSLVHADPGVRLEAAVILGKIMDPEALKPLLAALRDPVPAVRAHAAESLGLIGDARACGGLVKLLQDTDSNVRSCAAAALARTADASAADALLPLLKDEHAAVRGHAAAALGRTGDRRALAPLCTLASDQTEDVRSYALDALARFADESAFQTLLAGLSDPSPAVRVRAVGAMASLNTARIIDPLLKSLEDRDDPVRRRAAEVLGDLVDPLVIAGLIRVLEKDRSLEIRVAAARSLGQIADPAALPALQQALHEEFTLRCRACIAIGEIGTDEGVQTLLQLLKDPVGELRYHAAVGLGNLGDARALKPLEELIDDPDPFVLRGVGKALQQLGDPHGEDVLRRAREPRTATPTGSKSNPPARGTSQSATKRPRFRNLLAGLRGLPTRLIPNSLFGLLALPSSVPASPQQLAIGGGVVAGVAVVALFFAFGGFGSGSQDLAMSQRGTTRSLAFANDSIVGVLTDKGTLELWDSSTGVRKSSLGSRENGLTFIRGSATGGILLAAEGARIRRWDVKTATELAALEGHNADLLALNVSQDGQTLMSFDRAGRVQEWSVESGNSTKRAQAPDKLSIVGAVDPALKRFAGGTSDGKVRIWEFADAREFAVIPAHSGSVLSMAFSPDGKLLATSGDDNAIHVWDLVSRKRLKTIRQPGKSLMFDPTGKQLVVAADTTELVLIDATTFDLSVIGAGIDTVSTFAFSPDGQSLVLGGTDNFEVELINLETRSGILSMSP